MRFSYAGLILLLLMTLSCSEKEPMTKNYTLFVGTYTAGASEGIYKVSFNPNTGQLDSTLLLAKLPNPSFLTVSSDHQFLYAVQETADFDSLGGGVTAFSLQDGVLEELNSMGTGGAHPCHVALSDEGQLAISNYTGGNLSVFDLEGDGRLGKRQLIDHKILDSVKTSHVHKTHFNEGGLFVSDLGLDGIKRYTMKGEDWEPGHQASIELADGAGPRHFVFSEAEKFLYAINELNATITVFEQDDEGSYNPIQTESTIAADWEGAKSCADIHLSPDGRFLYGSNRGENTIVTFSVDKATGKIKFLERTSVQGDWPRNFTIDPSGNFLLVANERSNSISVFKRVSENGTLEFLHKMDFPSPVCLVFLDN
ncbi:MAG: lactonase family protein [Bacteroidota bacterium]